MCSRLSVPVSLLSWISAGSELWLIEVGAVRPGCAGSRQGECANLQNEAFDLPVAKLSALDVGQYRELQSELVFHLGNGQDGNKYIARWGDGDRGGIQVDPQTVLLFVKV